MDSGYSARPRQRRRRRLPPSPTSSDGLPSPVSLGSGATSLRHHLTTPRTKQRSITQLSELVRRQKQEALTRHPIVSTHTATESASPSSQSPPVESSRIQVAVRCRPRQSHRARVLNVTRGDDDACDFNEDEDDGDDYDDDTSASVVQYDLQERSISSRHPAVSVPSHVLALGGLGPHRRFEFDHVFPPSRGQREVYDACVKHAIDAVLLAAERTLSDASALPAHATILAYGQTGTGKTYTMGMLQHSDPATNHHEHGLIPRAIHQILSQLDTVNGRSETSGLRLVASMSFLQIYLETVQDLLQPAARRGSLSVSHSTSSAQTSSAPGLQVRLDPVTSVFYVPGLSDVPIVHMDDARALLEQATRSRVLASTARNRTSSRSHTLLTISVTAVPEDDGTDAMPAPRCTVSFVDLAGSERVEGALHFLHATRRRQELRIREAKFINRSLSALGSVIAVLAEQDASPVRRGSTAAPVVNLHATARCKPHIRFRDSQLTKLLQSRLVNGTGRLILIATIDDRAANLTETLSTLKFASQCRRVDLSQSNRALAAAASAKQSLVKQVFDEMKVVYEEREAEMRREYDARIQSLEAQLREAAVKPKQTAVAAYVALCSLVDMARQKESVAPHPEFASFQQDADAVKYVADLYRELKGVISAGRHAVEAVKPLAQPKLREVESTPARQPATVVSHGDIKESGHRRTLQGVEPSFQAVARHLFASGMLKDVDVSSDEESGGDEIPFSQMH